MTPRAAFAGFTLAAALACAAPTARAATDTTPLAFATYAADEEQLRHVVFLVESIRTFAGRWKDAPILVYVPAPVAATARDLVTRITALRGDVRTSDVPGQAPRFPFSGKVGAAAQAETEALAGTLVWMDEDTVVLDEPRDLLLREGVSVGYRPVMHNRNGSLFDRPPDAYWSRVYQDLSVPDSALFPVVTPADSQAIRAYFNAGLLAVRRERRILTRWAHDFQVLCGDTALVRMCRQDPVEALFLHQAALAGSILGRLPRAEMVELPPRYNVPLFFKQMYGARREFDSVAGVATLRYDVFFRNPTPGWEEKLKGPPATVRWLVERLGKK